MKKVNSRYSALQQEETQYNYGNSYDRQAQDLHEHSVDHDQMKLLAAFRSVADVISDNQAAQLLSPKEVCSQTLMELGFTLKTINLLFEKHPEVESVEDALQLLEKAELGYCHKFYTKVGHAQGTGLCAICSEAMDMHYEYN